MTTNTIITRTHIALLFGLTSLFEKDGGSYFKIMEVETLSEFDEQNPQNITCKVKVAFGPTHKLTLTFVGDVDIKEGGLGGGTASKWSLTYDDDGIRAAISSSDQNDPDSLRIFRDTLGI